LAVALLGSPWEMNMNSVAMRDRKTHQTIETEGYRVEVSGWDADECFFVEKSDSFSKSLHVRDLEAKLLDTLQVHGIVGRSAAMLEVFDLAKKISRHYANVLITGPTGSGKELVAHALHQMSPVAQERFAVCNCSALVDTLLESQLFGHMRGAFTGANATRPGLFEYADHGTGKSSALVRRK
jgi:transcriptional regulator with GAF, ATPase, and Fis domain